MFRKAVAGARIKPPEPKPWSPNFRPSLAGFVQRIRSTEIRSCLGFEHSRGRVMGFRVLGFRVYGIGIAVHMATRNGIDGLG